MATNYTMSDIVGDFDDFSQNHFNRQPMFRRGAVPEISDVLSLTDMDRLINLEVVRFPYIKVNLDGSGVPESGYTKDIVVQGQTVSGVVVPEKVHSLYRAGGTITWASINHVLPQVRDFIRVISDAMSVRTDAVAFLTPPNKKGYPAHHDGVDLFVVQLHGRKNWRLWETATERRSESASYTEEELGDPVIEETIEPGDVLYLPYGTPHQATALAEPSLHLSIMMRPRMWRDLLTDTVTRILEEDEFVEYPALFASYDGNEADFARMSKRLQERLSALDPEQEWERYRAEGRRMVGSSSSNTFVESSRVAGLGESSPLRRTSSGFSSRPLEDGRVRIEFEGLKFAVPAALAGVLAEHAADSLTSGAELLPAAPVERQRVLAQTLVRMGLYEAA